ncbi:MAG: universal stress protein, partial [Pirellulaceae bacterium]|nr:universal stress protein [Pirellulaceae bacterium]
SHHHELTELFRWAKGSVETIQGDGNAAHCILQHAERLDVDLIVVGARGHSAIGRILLGSVSDTVATHAKCSVLVVRTDDEQVSQLDQPLKITLAYDGSASSTEAAAELKHFRWPEDTSVTALAVVPSSSFFAPGHSVVIQNQIENEADRARQRVDALIGSLSATIANIDAQLAHGDHVGDAIIQSADESGSQLIVLGDTGHGLLSELILGSTTKYVLRHASCSVWISRHHRQSIPATQTSQSAKFAF